MGFGVHLPESLVAARPSGYRPVTLVFRRTLPGASPRPAAAPGCSREASLADIEEEGGPGRGAWRGGVGRGARRKRRKGWIAPLERRHGFAAAPFSQPTESSSFPVDR